MSKLSICLSALLCHACVGSGASRGQTSTAPAEHARPAPTPTGDSAQPADTPAAAIRTAEAPPVAMPELATRPTVAVAPHPGRALARLPVRKAAAGPVAQVPIADNRDAERKKLGKQIAAAKRLLRKQKPAKRFDTQLKLAELCARMATVAADDGAQTKWLAESTRLYLDLASDAGMAGAPKLDQVLFALASNLMSAGDAPQARKVYMRLVKNYPSSKLIPDVYVSFADYYFDQASMENARKFYEKALQFPGAAVHGYAQYKLGWVFFNLGEHQRALESFYRVVTSAKNQPGSQALMLASQAKRDMVRAYAQVGKPQKAHAFFKRVDPAIALELLARLGDVYRDQGKYAEAILIRREQMNLQPGAPDLCRFQIDIAEATAMLGKPDEAARELVRLATVHAGLAGKGTVPAEEQAHCGDSAIAMLGATGRRWHIESQKTLDAKTRERAATMYQTLGLHFPHLADAPETQYYLADILWRRAAAEHSPNQAIGRWREAAGAFVRCSDMASRSDPFFDDALLGAVLGYQNALAIARVARTRDDGLRGEVRTFLERVVGEHAGATASVPAQRLLDTLR